MKITAVAGCMLLLGGCWFGGSQVDPTAPPEGALILFDGTNLDQWASQKGGQPQWKITDGQMEIVPRKGSIVTKRKFNDFQLHIEFNVPQTPPSDNLQKRGNSGVYIQKRYEVQILDSYGIESGDQDCGALYRIRPPDKNVCKEPGQWQSYDITFQTARFEKTGDTFRKKQNARITVLHNGVAIHDDVEIPRKTGAGEKEAPTPGPILLQDHSNKVRFRNIWIVPSGTP